MYKNSLALPDGYVKKSAVFTPVRRVGEASPRPAAKKIFLVPLDAGEKGLIVSRCGTCGRRFPEVPGSAAPVSGTNEEFPEEE